jgi:ABC-type proline/glycine betaine transport system permease subunit
MKRISIVINALFTIIVSANLFAVASAPIQRIDVVNILSNGLGSPSQTSVLVAFGNGGALPCSKITLPFQGSTTVWAGIGQTCVTAVTSVTITAIAGPVGIGAVYDTTPITYSISSSFYSDQISIIQSIAPVFDGSSGAIIAAGFAQASIVNNLANN